MKWEEGRQGSGYKKLKIFESKRFECDCYLLKYEQGSSIPEHTDPVIEGKEHHRINIILKKPESGGWFCTWNGMFGRLRIVHNPNRRFFYFRPDITKHCVTKITKGTRIVLSIGWLKNAP